VEALDTVSNVAAPNPEKELDRLAALFAKEERPSVIVLQGAERWFRDRARDQIRASIAEGGDSF